MYRNSLQIRWWGFKKAPIFEFFPSKTHKFDKIHAKKNFYAFLNKIWIFPGPESQSISMKAFMISPVGVEPTTTAKT